MSTATTPGTRRSEPDTDAAAKRVAARGRSGRRGRARGRGGWWTRRRREPRTEVAAVPGRRRRWPWLLAIALVLVLLAGAVYAVFFSPLLGVRGVTIAGAPAELTAKVRAVVDVPDGTPLARVDLDAIAASVESVPEVAEVEVARSWPDTLAIDVVPRVPVAVTSANGQFWLLDAQGDPYLSVPAPPAGMITVQLVAPGTGDPSTSAALAVAASLTEQFRPQVAIVSARTAFDVELTLVDGRRVIWGEATDSAQKMQMLPALLSAQEGTEYDITDPSLVTVR